MKIFTYLVYHSCSIHEMIRHTNYVVYTYYNFTWMGTGKKTSIIQWFKKNAYEGFWGMFLLENVKNYIREKAHSFRGMID